MITERARPPASEYAPYYGKYIDLVPAQEILAQLKSQRDETVAFLRSIPESQAGVLHEPYTWTIRQVVGHLTDGERVFGYRALRIARGDATPLPGFDENAYAAAAESDGVSLAGLVDEFEAVRRANLLLFQHLPVEAWNRRGVASGQSLTVRALAYAIVGHARHHLAIVRKRLEIS